MCDDHNATTTCEERQGLRVEQEQEQEQATLGIGNGGFQVLGFFFSFFGLKLMVSAVRGLM